MIARVWHGWTTLENADAYERLLREEILPGIARHQGYRGAHLLRRRAEESADEVEFVTITWFESMDDVRAFSHDGARGAVVPPAARAVLLRFEERSAHYDPVLTPEETA